MRANVFRIRVSPHPLRFSFFASDTSPSCYRMNCPNDPSAAQLNSQLAETCAPYFATKDTSGTATAYPVPPSRPSTTAPLLYAAVALPSSTTVLAISANPLDLQYATAMGGGDIGLMPTSTAVPDVGVGSGGGVVGGVAGGVGGVGTGNPTPGVPRKTVWNWLSGVVSRKGRKATGSRRVIRLN